MFGPVASDPTVSRLVDTLAGDADQALAAIETARAAARPRSGRWPVSMHPTTTATARRR